MRTRHTTIASLGIVIAAGFLQMAGCSADADDCSRNNICNDDGQPFVVGPPPGCTDSPSSNPDVIKTECAFFVNGSKGDDNGAGTEAAPFKTLKVAIEAARKNKARVYACGDYAERVDVPAGVSIFGGFDCQDVEWRYDASKKARINPPAPTSPDEVQASLRVAGNNTSQLEGLRIEAANATLPGGSAIAVIVDGATVNFVGTALIAGNGAAGDQGATPTDDIGPSSPDDSAIRGNDGKNACMGGASGNTGGAAKANSICSESSGGKGGNGQEASGDAGGDGIPAPNPNPSNKGIGGLGDMGQGCDLGQPGANGASGNEGAGAVEDGTLDATKGYIGVSGQPGSKGTVGQGGGGGGGSKGKSDCFGASGGSGGAGGCGGNGGLGGTAGGSSIGILSLGAKLSFQMVDVTTGTGGRGGDGGFGQSGGAGGNGGNGGTGASSPSTPAGCNGGKGGNGGSGGTGGGGKGGHAIGIAYKGGTVPDMGVTIVNGTPGDGGNGGGATGGIGTMTHAFP
ncbi:hypothetical protein [Polyangium mundeleinium]|uniref:DUF1565 domain-containing protein n=1 Tax=Polyangium mundeleinium TaxID=2995306 RepID=A0ABT5EKF0_9BACT|nr:hypothetical protein [Polyangium mundeleinium]MDC0742322.1 hypothetical protein [Polyangium mundeleinium]